MLIGTAIQTGSQNIGMFIGARALIGFGLGIAAVSNQSQRRADLIQ